MTEQERQKKATEIASRLGFDLTIFVGEKNGLKIYLAGNKDRRATGLPYFVTFDQNDKPDDCFGFDYMDLVEQYVEKNGE